MSVATSDQQGKMLDTHALQLREHAANWVSSVIVIGKLYSGIRRCLDACGCRRTAFTGDPGCGPAHVVGGSVLLNLPVVSAHYRCLLSVRRLLFP